MKKSTLEIDEGAVLVIGGQYQNRIGFYCLQNEQTYDIGNIIDCPDCRLTNAKLMRSVTHGSGRETFFNCTLEIETGSYCTSHLKALIEHDMAVVYWDRPYGNDYSLVHPSALIEIPSIEYARYEKECKRDVDKALLRLLKVLGNNS